MSSSGAGGTLDWFELSNLGTNSVVISGWRMDDNSFSFAGAATLNGVTNIAGGESVVFIEDSTT
ncbi:MAG: PEP-CTERM sorting domain-containing protein, partial [Planctomycetia bacterium]